jgi:hypothetical protein
MTRPIDNAKLHENCLIIFAFPSRFSGFSTRLLNPELTQYLRRVFNQN